jgi:hypothetical protein
MATWLVEEAQVRAPDRVLHSARQSMDRTRQRRFVVAWREPMFISQARLAGMTAAIAIALVGAAWAGRVSAPSNAGALPVATPTVGSPSPTATLESYQAAHDEICVRYRAQIDGLKPQFDGMYDRGLSASDRASRAATLRTYVVGSEAMTRELALLRPPAQMASEHGAMVAKYEDVNALIRLALGRLADGDLGSAEAFDLATDPLSREIEAFDRTYGLKHCP